MGYVKLFEDKALGLSNRRLYDDIYSNLTSRQQKTLLNKSRDWYQGNTQKTKIELLAEDKHIKLLKETIYKDINYLFDGNSGTRLKINKSEAIYFKEIRKQLKK